MLSRSIWFSAPSFWMGGGLQSRCVGRVYGADGARHFTLFYEEDARSNNPQVLERCWSRVSTEDGTQK
jgi:hypothetical protein